MNHRAVRAAVVCAVACLSGAASLTASLAIPVAAPAITHAPRLTAGNLGATGWSASNWSGYAIAGGPYTSVAGTWVVPSVAPSRKQSYASSWVGIDGFTNSSLIQAGTESDWSGGSAHYYAWWEILPAAETAIAMAVQPGDTISVAITQVSAGTFHISLADVTTGASFTTTQGYSGPLTSVEWIVEAPSIGSHVATLAHYSSPELFDPGSVNGAAPGFTADNSGVMVQHGQQVSTPSLPDADADGFTMAYGSTAPDPPQS